MEVRSRRFPAKSQVAAVYDWAGSLAPDIVDCTLCDPAGTSLPPSCELEHRCTLVMATATHDDIQFMGFGDVSNGINTTLPDCEGNTEGTEIDADV